MSLLDVLRSGIATADAVTKPLQPTVSYERYTGADLYGTPTFAAAISLNAIVDWKQKQLRTSTGVLSVSRASIMLLNIADVVTATGGAGINDEDKFTLPDGTTGPILDMSGFIDAGTGHPIATEIFIG